MLQLLARVDRSLAKCALCFLVACGSAAVLPSHARAMDDAAGMQADARAQTIAAEPIRSDLTATIPAGQAVLIDNPYGDVRLRFGGYEHAVDMHATLQQPDGVAPITLHRGEEGGRYVIAPRLPAGAVLDEAQRIDLVVYVAEKHPVSVRTERGMIEGRGLKSDLDLKSVDGDIVLRGTEGTVQAETGAGLVEMSLSHARPGSTQRISSRTGNIVLAVDDQLDAEVQLATSGMFATEYSLVVTPRPGEEPNKHARAVVGAAKAVVVLESRRGEIRLMRRTGFNPADLNPAEGTQPPSSREGAMNKSQAP